MEAQGGKAGGAAKSAVREQQIVFGVLKFVTWTFAQAALLGEDLRRHEDFGFEAGEVRRVQLSLTPFDDSPKRIPCPRPPNCL